MVNKHKLNKKVKLLILLLVGIIASTAISVMVGNYESAEAAWSPVQTINKDDSVKSLVTQTGNFDTNNYYEKYFYTSKGEQFTAKTLFWNTETGQYEYLDDVNFTGGTNTNYKFNHFAYYMYSYDGSSWSWDTNPYVTDASDICIGNNDGSSNGNLYLENDNDLVAAFADSVKAPNTALGTFDVNQDYIYMYDEIQRGGKANDVYRANVDTTVFLTQSTDGSYVIKFRNDTYSATENGTAVFNFTPNAHAKIDGFYLYDLDGNLLETLVINNSATGGGVNLSQETPMVIVPFGELNGIDVAGNVVDVETEEVLSDVTVTIKYDDQVVTAKTDENGNFILAEQIVPTTDITFTFTKDGYEELTKTVDVLEAWYGGAIYVQAKLVPIKAPDPAPVTPTDEGTSNATGNAKTYDSTAQLVCVLGLVIALATVSCICARNSIGVKSKKKKY